MDPRGDNCPIKLSDLTFEVFSDYLNQLRPKQQRNDIKSEMLSSSMYDLNRSGMIYMFKMSKFGTPSDNFVQKL